MQNSNAEATSCIKRICWDSLCFLFLYLRQRLFIRAGEVILVEVLGVEDSRPRVVGGARRQRQHLLLLLILPLLPGNFSLLGLEGEDELHHDAAEHH